MEAQQKAYDKAALKLDTLLDMRLAKKLTDDEYEEKKKTLMEEKERLFTAMQNTDNRQNDWLSKAEDALTFAHTAREQFALAVKNKDYKRQRVLIAAFGSNLVLKNKTLSIQAKPLLSTIKEILPAVPDAQEGFEPKEYRANKTQKDQEFTPSPIWLRG